MTCISPVHIVVRGRSICPEMGDDDRKGRSNRAGPGQGTPQPERTLDMGDASSVALHTRDEGERAIRAKVHAGDVLTAASDAARLYGAEIFGFLAGIIDGHTARGEVYAGVLQSVAEEISAFEWHCSLRTWMYARARRELARHREQLTVRGSSDSIQPVALPDLKTQVPIGGASAPSPPSRPSAGRWTRATARF
jgi:hypothetical protein